MFRPAIVLILSVASASIALAAGDPEAACQKGRVSAAARFAACEQKAASVVVATGDHDKLSAAVGKCRVKYQAAWAKLWTQALGTGSSCDTDRFVEVAGTTVVDNLTGLQWEMKTDDGGVHDKDDFYDWSATSMTSPAADGAVFTTFLATLNGGCFAGQCDWRLPTRGELETILSQGYPCAENPCIPPGFGPTNGSLYWASTNVPGLPRFAWTVHFGTGYVFYNYTHQTSMVRAVRGGL
ncbi:MAG: DUF1566 domain-containing protein [Deltaproteobacteria bacterium]|nr:DUF1566 domain-containing protein [Deltaproteobacteria bacterium]